MTIGEAIRIVRRRKGLGQRELAGRAGVSQALVSLIENGRRQPTVHLVEQLAATMQVPPQLILLLGCKPAPGLKQYETCLEKMGLAMLELLEAVG